MKLSNYLHLPGDGTVELSADHDHYIGAGTVPPMTVECKRGPDSSWWVRADWSSGAWMSGYADGQVSEQTLRRMLFDEWPMHRVRVVGAGRGDGDGNSNEYDS